MKYCRVSFIPLCLVFIAVSFSHAHFGMIIPSDTMVMQTDQRQIDLLLSFSHPFEMIGIPLSKPRQFFVVEGEKTKDLTGTLEETRMNGHMAWKTRYAPKRPGAYQFVMEPEPFWEPSEDIFIIHYTKTIVAAFGDDTGWDRELGLKTEIVPLSRPFGLYAGNLFQGIVRLDGKVVPFAEVEVEYYNEDRKAVAPTDYMVTQTIKSDINGVFSYAVPVQGWWGFAALQGSDEKMIRDNEEKGVELGAVLWVRFENWQEK